MNTTEQQFSQLVRDNRSTIYAVCYMFSNDADEVADLFQEVLVKLWNGYETFHGKSDVKTWIYMPADAPDFARGAVYGGIVGGVIGGFCGLIFAFRVFFKMQRTNDEVISQINELNA